MAIDGLSFSSGSYVTDAELAASAPTSATASVATDQTTSSSTYTDLATVGPAVTVTTGSKALVILTGAVYNGTANSRSHMGFAVSGSSTIAASDTQALQNMDAGSNNPAQNSAVYLVTGLTPGSNTFTVKYRAGSNVAGFFNRSITVINMGS